MARWTDGTSVVMSDHCPFGEENREVASEGDAWVAGQSAVFACKETSYAPAARTLVFTSPIERWSVPHALASHRDGAYFTHGGAQLLDGQGRSLWKRETPPGVHKIHVGADGTTVVFHVGPHQSEDRETTIEVLNRGGLSQWKRVLPITAGPSDFFDDGPATVVTADVSLHLGPNHNVRVGWSEYIEGAWSRVLVYSPRGVLRSEHRFTRSMNGNNVHSSGALILAHGTDMQVLPADGGLTYDVNLLSVVLGLKRGQHPHVHADRRGPYIAVRTPEQLVVLHAPSPHKPASWRLLLHHPLDPKVWEHVSFEGDHVVLTHKDRKVTWSLSTLMHTAVALAPAATPTEAPATLTVQNDGAYEARWNDGTTMVLNDLCPFGERNRQSASHGWTAGSAIVFACILEAYEPVSQTFVMATPTERWSVPHALQSHGGGAYFSHGATQLFDRNGQSLWKRPPLEGYHLVDVHASGAMAVFHVAPSDSAEHEVTVEMIDHYGESRWRRTLPVTSEPAVAFGGGPAVDPSNIATLDLKANGDVSVHWAQWRAKWTRAWVFDEGGASTMEYRAAVDGL